MSDSALRGFNREMSAVVGATVDVTINNGKVYTGTLRGIDQNTLSIVLSDVTIQESGERLPRIFLYGNSIVSFSFAEEEVSLEGLAKQLEKQFPPGGVRFFGDTGVIVVMNKIRITPDGIDGTGPLYERVKAVYDEWIQEHGLE
ncbi:MAG: Lsm family RNA-binding protein [Candidatus Thorarchaeota archaeon]